MMGTLIADDLTGACDAAAPLAGRAPVPVFVAPGSPDTDWSIAAVDTETRGLEAREAAQLVGAAARRLGGRLSRGWLLKKIDSTLRGPVGAELEALLESSERSTAVVCPSFPGEGRAVVGGALRVHGALAHQSPIGRDPAYPAPTSDVAELLQLGARRPVSRLPLADVRGGPAPLAQALARATGHLIAADAETDADLDALAAAALAVPHLVMAGSAGLARAAAAALGEAGPPPPLPAAPAWLIGAGKI